MKGIILNLIEEAVVASQGEDAWEELLVRSDLDGVFTSLGDYPDDHVHRLLEADAALLGTDADAVAHDVGHAAVLGLARRYPAYFSSYDDPMTFLPTLSEVIHPEVRKLYPHSDPPEFWFESLDEHSMRVHYRSARRLCGLAEGMLAGCATYFGRRADLTQDRCVREGADHCVIDVRFDSP